MKKYVTASTLILLSTLPAGAYCSPFQPGYSQCIDNESRLNRMEMDQRRMETEQRIEQQRRDDFERRIEQERRWDRERQNYGFGRYPD